jgi:hypothetical protein
VRGLFVMEPWELQMERAKADARRPFFEKHPAFAIVCGVLLFCAVLAGVIWTLHYFFPFH